LQNHGLLLYFVNWYKVLEVRRQLHHKFILVIKLFKETNACHIKEGSQAAFE